MHIPLSAKLESILKTTKPVVMKLGKWIDRQIHFIYLLLLLIIFFQVDLNFGFYGNLKSQKAFNRKIVGPINYLRSFPFGYFQYLCTYFPLNRYQRHSLIF